MVFSLRSTLLALLLCATWIVDLPLRLGPGGCGDACCCIAATGGAEGDSCCADEGLAKVTPPCCCGNDTGVSLLVVRVGFHPRTARVPVLWSASTGRLGLEARLRPESRTPSPEPGPPRQG